MSIRRHLAPAIVAAAAYLVVAAITIVQPQPTQNWDASGLAMEAAFVVALLGSAAACQALVRDLTASGLGSRAGRLAQVGFLGIAVAALASLIKRGDTLGPVFLLSLLATLVGLLLLGVAALRDGLCPRWAAVVPFASMLIGIALADHGGCAVIAIGWILTVSVQSGVASDARSTAAAA